MEKKNYGKTGQSALAPWFYRKKTIMEIMVTSKNYGKKKVRITSGIFWTLMGKNLISGFYPHLKPFWLPWTMCDIPVSLYILYTVSSNPIPKLPLATSKEFRLHRQKLHKLPSHADTAAKKLANNAWTLVHCIANAMMQVCQVMFWNPVRVL